MSHRKTMTPAQGLGAINELLTREYLSAFVGEPASIAGRSLDEAEYYAFLLRFYEEVLPLKDLSAQADREELAARVRAQLQRHTAREEWHTANPPPTRDDGGWFAARDEMFYQTLRDHDQAVERAAKTLKAAQRETGESIVRKACDILSEMLQKKITKGK